MKFAIIQKTKIDGKNHLPSKGMSIHNMKNCPGTLKHLSIRESVGLLNKKKYIENKKGFSPRTSIDGSKIIVHSEFVNPLGLTVIAEYEQDDPIFHNILESSEWKIQEEIEIDKKFKL